MDEQMIFSGVLVDEESSISFVEICQKYNIPQEMLTEMIDHGLVKPQVQKVDLAYFDNKMVWRIQSARRLQEDLSINLPGVALVLELLDEMEKMRTELSILQHHVSIEFK